MLKTGIWLPDIHFINLQKDSQESQYGWYKSLKNFEKIAEIGDSLDIRTAVIVLPSNVQVDTSHYSFYRKIIIEVNSDLLFSNAPQQVLYQFSGSSHFDYLDLLPYFKIEKGHDSLYLVNDNHLSEAGHKLAFREVKGLLDLFLFEPMADKGSRKRNYYKKFEEARIAQKMLEIKNDKEWFEMITKKAAENKIPVDLQLRLDAEYVLSTN